jgi:hypothetical protein
MSPDLFLRTIPRIGERIGERFEFTFICRCFGLLSVAWQRCSYTRVDPGVAAILVFLCVVRADS